MGLLCLLPVADADAGRSKWRHWRSTTTTTVVKPTTTTVKVTTTTTKPVTTTTKAPVTTTTAKPATTTTFVPTGAVPAQPALIVYGSSTGISAYAKPGALVIAGRDNYDDQAFKDISAAGGSVLFYLDAVIDNDYGRYTTLLNQQSVCGPATSAWPGNIKANEWGNLNDFRPGSLVQQKLECVLEIMVSENPHMAGFFADDVGSRSWFDGFDWSSWSSADKALYRQGAIDLVTTFRKVADRHGLLVMVNGTWSAGAANGGGYPDVNQTGMSLADGGFIEHHDTVDTFFRNYACASQWASQSKVTGPGRAINFAVNNTDAGTRAWAQSGCVAYSVTQVDYGEKPAPWGPFYNRGLPARVQY